MADLRALLRHQDDTSTLCSTMPVGLGPSHHRHRHTIADPKSTVLNPAGGDTRLRHMTRVIMEAFAALSPERVQAVKEHEKSPGHMGQLRAVLKHRRGAAVRSLSADERIATLPCS